MKVTAELTPEELDEFLEWRRDKEKYTKLFNEPAHTLKEAAKSARMAIAPADGGDAPTFEIIDQSHMSDLWLFLVGE